MMDFMSSDLNGIPSLPRAGARGFLAVTNTAVTETSVKAIVRSQEETFTLRPRETRLLELGNLASLLHKDL
jgi:hypothetical protein